MSEASDLLMRTGMFGGPPIDPSHPDAYVVAVNPNVYECPICRARDGELSEPCRKTPWRPIETAPKGGGAERVDDPAWVDPPRILLLFKKDEVSVAYWESYYAEGGDGYTGDPYGGWIEPVSGEPVIDQYGYPTHWMPKPGPPQS